jgi:methionyl-tRNA formyltransferase
MGVLTIKKLQQTGRKAMNISDFLLGFKISGKVG